MSDRYLLTPFFFDQHLPDLEDLVAAGCERTRKVCLGLLEALTGRPDPG